jgi:cob(I)alamin adenosyltransferase
MLENPDRCHPELVSTPRDFILPGDTLAGATLGLSRTVVRRAERRVAKLLANGEIENTLLLKYLNRLSSLCFALELLENFFVSRTPTKAKK